MPKPNPSDVVLRRDHVGGRDWSTPNAWNQSGETWDQSGTLRTYLEDTVISDALQDRYTVRFYRDNEPVITVNLKTGELTIADHLTTDEAARAFWEAVRKTFHAYEGTL